MKKPRTGRAPAGRVVSLRVNESAATNVSATASPGTDRPGIAEAADLLPDAEPAEAHEAIIEYDLLDAADDLLAIRQAFLQAYGRPMPHTELVPYANALASGQASRLALVLQLVDAARDEGHDIILHFHQPMQSYLPGLSAGGGLRAEGWTPTPAIRLVDLSDIDVLDDEALVRYGYIHVLGKPADREGLAHQLYRLQSGSSRLDVLADLAAAARRNGEPVAFQLRDDALTRLGQKPLNRLSEILAGSAEDCIRAMYRTILGKAADEGGLAHYLWQLSSGRSRLSVYAELRAVAAQEGRHVVIDCDLDPESLQQAIAIPEA
jgi:hypothetical protein